MLRRDKDKPANERTAVRILVVDLPLSLPVYVFYEDSVRAYHITGEYRHDKTVHALDLIPIPQDPIWRPFKPEELQVGMVFRRESGAVFMTVTVNAGMIYLNPEVSWQSPQSLFDNYKYGGLAWARIPWQKAGVLE